MPRRSGHNSDESPVPRRTSARIAAVQAASPAKSPAKSPRRKRQSTEVSKAASEDTESQQSQIKSEGSIEELNGLETSSSTKDRDSIIDSQELPPKKAKLNEHPTGERTEVPQITPADEVPQPTPVEEVAESIPENEVTQTAPTDSVTEVVPVETETPVEQTPMTIPVISDDVDFEVVEKSDVPPADSAEVKAAVSVQGEDGQLLVGFVQVDKDELPSSTSLEVKHVTLSEQPEDHTVELTAQDIPPVADPTVNSINGDSEHMGPTDEVAPLTNQTEPEHQSKLASVVESVVQPSSAPAAGDAAIDVMCPEAIPQ